MRKTFAQTAEEIAQFNSVRVWNEATSFARELREKGVIFVTVSMGDDHAAQVIWTGTKEEEDELRQAEQLAIQQLIQAVNQASGK